MKSKKMLALLLGVFMLAALFAGCGEQAEVESTSPDKTDGTQSPDQEKSITLSFVYWADGVQKDLVEAAVATYEDANPNIKITAEALPASGEFPGIIESRMQSNTLPDVSYMGEGDIMKYNEMGILADISPLFKGEDAAQKLDAITIKDSEGHILGIGLSNQLELLYYNKQMFDDAGIPYPSTNVADAWEWGEFVEIAKKLTKDTNGRNATEAGFNPQLIETYGLGLSATMAFHHFWALYSNGGGVVSADGGEFLWDKPESVEAMQKFIDLINVDHVANAVTNTWWTDLGNIATVDSGGAAMMFNGSWDLANIPSCSVPNNIGVAVLPKLKKAVTMNCGAPLVVYNTSQNIDEAMAFAKYMLDPDNNLPLLQSGAWLPNDVSWYTDEALIAEWTANLPEDAVATIMSYSTTPDAIVQWPAYYVPAYNKMDVAFAASDIDKAWAGEISAQQLFDEIMQNMKTLFESGTVE
ncbi:MAG: sugar ABC transporter substrate-binding protein [Christensenellales bacterium]